MSRWCVPMADLVIPHGAMVSNVVTLPNDTEDVVLFTPGNLDQALNFTLESPAVQGETIFYAISDDLKPQEGRGFVLHQSGFPGLRVRASAAVGAARTFRLSAILVK
jgi:hypothetical protein